MRKLYDYHPYLSEVLALCARSTTFMTRPPLREILAAERRLVVAVNHAAPLSWLPAAALLACKAVDCGGGDRRPIGVMDRAFFRLPVVRFLAQYLTQTKDAPTFRELIAKFNEEGDIDLIVFPEGSNCFFGLSEELRAFRSPKFVELAIRTGTPVLIIVHRGSENWGRSLRIPQSWFDKLDFLPQPLFDFFAVRIREFGRVVLPMLPLPMKQFSMLGELYRPTLTAAELSRNSRERSQQIRVECERIRKRMLEILLELETKPFDGPGSDLLGE